MTEPAQGRRVIAGYHVKHGNYQQPDSDVLIVICDDGTTWERVNRYPHNGHEGWAEWRQLDRLPQP